MTQWTAFAVVSVLVLVVVLAFARATAALAQRGGGSTADRSLSEPSYEGETAAEERRPDRASDGRSKTLDAAETGQPNDEVATGTDRRDGVAPFETEQRDVAAAEGRDAGVSAESGRRDVDAVHSDIGSRNGDVETVDLRALSKRELFANVALTQGLFGVILVGTIWATDVPASALGIEATPGSTGLPAIAIGVGLGVVLYVANVLAAANLERFGVEFDELLRELLAPDSIREWVVLLLLVLPIVALFEELLFRAVLIGAFATGFGLSPWVLAVLSSAAFGLGHGLQGPAGVVVTGVLGFVLAGAFVVTESLVVVIVAHYLINALEFVVNEGLGVEVGRTRGS